MSRLDSLQREVLAAFFARVKGFFLTGGAALAGDLVDLRALEAGGYAVEDHLELAHRKDAGLTAGQLAWVLSQIEIGDDARLPGGASVDELRQYLVDLINRLTKLAFPSSDP